jgi:hypothetical protein
MALAFFLLGLFQAANCGEPPQYVNKLSLQAAVVMEKIASRSPKELGSEVELAEWARARLAWIALRRLEGREKEALRIFLGCGEVCGKYGPEKEWQAEKAWGCPKKREAVPCLSKTKARKPPR